MNVFNLESYYKLMSTYEIILLKKQGDFLPSLNVLISISRPNENTIQFYFTVK